MSALTLFLRRLVADRMATPVERGQTLVLVALAAAGILGMCALGIDLARLYDARSEAQNAADHAATTAAFSSCRLQRTTAVAISDGMAAAAANGFDNDGTTNTVGVLHVSGTQFRANTTRTIDTSFAAVIGWASLDAAATALGDCTDAAGGIPAAIYAGGDSCYSSSNKGVQVSGSKQDVYGGVHSNKDVAITGGNNNFTNGPAAPDDPFTYVGAFHDGGSGNTYASGYPQQVPMPSPQWPTGWAPSSASLSFFQAYRAAAIANGTYSASKITRVTRVTRDGVYFSDSPDGIDISSLVGAQRNVVLVAPNGPIKVSGSNWTLDPYNAPGLPRDNILIVSGLILPNNEKCDKYVISVSGSKSFWNGIMWGPGGLIEMSGSDNSASNGTLVGWAVRLNGSDLDITYNPDLFVATPEVLLLE